MDSLRIAPAPGPGPGRVRVQVPCIVELCARRDRLARYVVRHVGLRLSSERSLLSWGDAEAPRRGVFGSRWVTGWVLRLRRCRRARLRPSPLAGSCNACGAARAGGVRIQGECGRVTCEWGGDVASRICAVATPTVGRLIALTELSPPDTLRDQHAFRSASSTCDGRRCRARLDPSRHSDPGGHRPCTRRGYSFQGEAWSRGGVECFREDSTPPRLRASHRIGVRDPSAASIRELARRFQRCRVDLARAPARCGAPCRHRRPSKRQQRARTHPVETVRRLRWSNPRHNRNQRLFVFGASSPPTRKARTRAR